MSEEKKIEKLQAQFIDHINSTDKEIKELTEKIENCVTVAEVEGTLQAFTEGQAELELKIEKIKTVHSNQYRQLSDSMLGEIQRTDNLERVLRGLCDELLKPISLIKNIEALKEKLDTENVNKKTDPELVETFMENKSVLDALGEEEQEPDWSDKSRKCTFCEKIAPNELFVCDEHWDQYKDGIPTPAWQTEKKDCKHYIINKCIENDYDCNFCPFGITGRKRRAEQAQEDADKSLDEVLPHFDKVLLPKKTIFPKVKEPDIDIPTPKVQEWACFKCNLQGKTGVPICMGLCADHYVELNQIENKLINKILADLRELETNGHWDYVMPEEIKEDLKRELKYKIADYEGMLKK